MPLLSVITAAWAPSADHLEQVAASVLSQQLPAGWELEWLVQEDGEQPRLRTGLPSDRRIRYRAVGVRAGIAGTRNLALARARGDLLRVLDHDDLITEGALARQIGVLEAHPDVAWVGGTMRVRRPDGGLEPDRARQAAGRVAAGWVMAHFRSRELFPLWCGNLVMRTRPVRALGGWGALPRSEDLLLVGALSELFDGWWLTDPVGEYRLWPAQTVATHDWQRLKEVAWSAVHARVDALRSEQSLHERVRGSRRIQTVPARPAPALPPARGSA